MMRRYISAWLVLIVASQQVAAWDDRAPILEKSPNGDQQGTAAPRPPLRPLTLPRSSETMLTQEEARQSGNVDASPQPESSGPVFATFRSQPIKPPPEHFTVLGKRDDSLEHSYVLEGRGKEVGAGTRKGRYCEPGMERAGHPHCTRLVSQPSPDCHHSLGYIGGGTPFHYWGDRRFADEGTVGLDYSGRFFHRKVWLLWSHGELHQGGAGRYETDGPRILPEK